jgi:hypothetical protein
LQARAPAVLFSVVGWAVSAMRRSQTHYWHFPSQDKNNMTQTSMRLYAVILATGLSLSMAVQAESNNPSDSMIEAEKLLASLKIQAALDRSMSQMLDAQLQQSPSLLPYRNIMLSFFEKHMSYKTLKPDMVKLYSRAFTTDELREINAFYATDVGKKTIQKMPLLVGEAGRLGAKRVQKAMPELQSMIKAEAKRMGSGRR